MSVRIFGELQAGLISSSEDPGENLTNIYIKQSFLAKPEDKHLRLSCFGLKALFLVCSCNKKNKQAAAPILFSFSSEKVTMCLSVVAVLVSWWKSRQTQKLPRILRIHCHRKKKNQTWERLHGQLGLLRIDFILDWWVDVRKHKLHLTYCGTKLTQRVSTWLSTLQRKTVWQNKRQKIRQ